MIFNLVLSVRVFSSLHLLLYTIINVFEALGFELLVGKLRPLPRAPEHYDEIFLSRLNNKSINHNIINKENNNSGKP